MAMDIEKYRGNGRLARAHLTLSNLAARRHEVATLLARRVNGLVHGLAHDLVDTFIPKRCALCGDIDEIGFCRQCQPLLPWIDCACEICSQQLLEPGVCGQCQVQPPNYHASIIPFHYQQPIMQAISRFKFHADLVYASPLGEMLALVARRESPRLPDVLMPVPLHNTRLRQRGYNQALEIAKVVGKKLNLPIVANRLQRRVNTQPQTRLNQKQRLKNVRRAFVAKDVSEFSHIALVDDVVTSGATANAAARALRRAQAQKISIWAVAKTRFDV